MTSGARSELGVLRGVPLEGLLDGRWIGVGIHDKSRVPRTDPNSKSNIRIQALHAEHLDRLTRSRG